MPQAVQGMPIVLEADVAVDLGGVLAALRDVGMQPLGVVDGPLSEAARNWGLAILPPEAGKSRPVPAAAMAPAPAAEPEPAAIGSASGRERGCQYWEIKGAARSLKKK